jgi:hypothetical protein
LFKTLDRERPEWRANIEALAADLRKLRIRVQEDQKRASELRHLTHQTERRLRRTTAPTSNTSPS